MIPLLFDAQETLFLDGNIKVRLFDTIECLVQEAINGKYELKLKYPMDGVGFDKLKMREIILAKPNNQDRPQPFRIYRISKPMNGAITVFGQHISYDLSGFPVRSLGAFSLFDLIEQVKTNMVVENNFNFSTDREFDIFRSFYSRFPRSARSLLLSGENSAVTTYGGEWHFDRFDAVLENRRTTGNQMLIRYGVNLIDLDQEEKLIDVYTGILPYALGENEEVVVLNEKIIHAEGNFGYTKILTKDFTDLFVDENGEPLEINEENLRNIANKFMSETEFGVPEVSITCSPINLGETVEFKGSGIPVNGLGDDVSVYFEKLGINARARIVAVVYNSLKERFEQLQIGSVQKRITDTILSLKKKVEKI